MNNKLLILIAWIFMSFESVYAFSGIEERSFTKDQTVTYRHNMLPKDDGITIYKKNNALYGVLYCTVEDKGCTRLHYAALFRAAERASQLLSEGVDINAPDKNGYRPLHLTSMKITGLPENVGCEKQKEFAAMLLNEGADIQAKDNRGRTALHFATEGECEDLIFELAKRGGDMTARDHKGETPLMILFNKELERFNRFKL